MDQKKDKKTEEIEKTLSQTTNKIKKIRKKVAEKEEEEFREIHRLLENSDDGDNNDEENTPPLTLSPVELIASQVITTGEIPLTNPGIVIFEEDNLFSLFDEKTLALRDFLKNQEKCLEFGRDISALPEDIIRGLISPCVTECLLADETSHALSLYVLYLLSVHPDPLFVTTCFEFLISRRFNVAFNEILPIFINLGASLDILCDSSPEIELPVKFNNNGDRETQKKFPLFNLEMLAHFLIHCIRHDLYRIDESVGVFLRAITKITLDPRIRSSHLSIYATLVSVAAAKVVETEAVEDVVSWLHLSNEHLLNQTEVCRNVVQTLNPDLHQALVLKTIKFILKSENIKLFIPITVKEIKLIFVEAKKKKIDSLEIYCLLQLIIGTLPTVTATVDEFKEISRLLNLLEGRIVQAKDSTDLMRLKLDVAKLRILAQNKIVNRFEGDIAIDSSATHVIIEDSVGGVREKSLSALKNHGLKLTREVKYVSTRWISKCLSEKKLVDTEPFEFPWVSTELNYQDGKNKKQEKRRSSVRETGDDEGESSRFSATTGKKNRLNVENYECSQPSASSKASVSPQKQQVIDELQKLADVYRNRNDNWRAYGYDKAIRAISRYEKDFSSFQEVSSIPGVGEKMALKIVEILESGKLRKAEELCSDEKTKVLDVFCKIWGVGPSTAETWYQLGCRTLDDLKTKAKLTKQQHIGLKHFDDIQKRIPREEVEKIGSVVQEELLGISNALEIVPVGSYRRGKMNSGDVDIMVVNPGLMTATEVLVQLTNNLKDKGFITDDLVTLEEVGNHRKYFGVCKLPGENQIHRRLDIFVVPESEYATALMHYTGSAYFNRSIRLLASRKDMSLTEHGLYTNVVRQGVERINDGQLVPTPTEQDIFSHLGLDYRSPEERDH